jgi:hypothetical protein
MKLFGLDSWCIIPKGCDNGDLFVGWKIILSGCKRERYDNSPRNMLYRNASRTNERYVIGRNEKTLRLFAQLK